ncbi:MAG TPA: hypothetical protein VIC08_16575 [Cellvibrionaceae bacterium]
MFKTMLEWLWRRNPVTRIIYSRAPVGLKLVALSLVLVFISAAPVFIFWLINPAADLPWAAAWFFALGTGLAHIGFVVGLVLLIVAVYRKP